MRVSRQGDWLAAKAGEEMVMMSPTKGRYVGLTAVGARIWELIAEPQAMDDICARLTAEFEVDPQACRAEVEAFLTDLAGHGVVALEP